MDFALDSLNLYHLSQSQTMETSLEGVLLISGRKTVVRKEVCAGELDEKMKNECVREKIEKGVKQKKGRKTKQGKHPEINTLKRVFSGILGD
jgi:hypothetical protein